MTALQDAPPLAPHRPPPIHVSRAGRRYPHDYGGPMDDAWHLAWQILKDNEWHDAAPLATWVAEQSGIEVESARSMLKQAVRRGVLHVRHRLRGRPRRWRAEYAVRPALAETYEREAASIVERFLRRGGRRDGFDPQADLPAFRSWLATSGYARRWARCQSGANMDTDADLLSAVGRTCPRVIAEQTPRGSFRPSALTRSIPRRREGGPVLVDNPAQPAPEELAALKRHALQLVKAVANGDWPAAWALRPQSASDGGYLATSLAELVIDLARDSGQPLGAWVEQAQVSATRGCRA
jgi:hypothetical protein